MQVTITARTARTLLAQRSLTVEQLKRTGRVDLAPNVFMTLHRNRRYTLIDNSMADNSPAAGDGIAMMVEHYDRHLIPAWTPDQDGSLPHHRIEAQHEADRLEHVRRTLHA